MSKYAEPNRRTSPCIQILQSIFWRQMTNIQQHVQQSLQGWVLGLHQLLPENQQFTVTTFFVVVKVFSHFPLVFLETWMFKKMLYAPNNYSLWLGKGKVNSAQLGLYWRRFSKRLACCDKRAKISFCERQVIIRPFFGSSVRKWCCK